MAVMMEGNRSDGTNASSERCVGNALRVLEPLALTPGANILFGPLKLLDRALALDMMGDA